MQNRTNESPDFRILVLRAGLEPARIAPHAPQTCAATNYATSAWKIFKNYLFALALLVFAAAFDVFALFAVEFTFAFAFVFVGVTAFAFVVFAFVLTATFVFAVFASTFVLVFVFAAGVSVVEVVVDKTETSPVNAGIAKSRAESIKQVAAPMVSFDKTVAVPRGPKALLETLLVKSAPASVLPG